MNTHLLVIVLPTRVEPLCDLENVTSHECVVLVDSLIHVVTDPARGCYSVTMTLKYFSNLKHHLVWVQVLNPAHIRQGSSVRKLSASSCDANDSIIEFL